MCLVYRGTENFESRYSVIQQRWSQLVRKKGTDSRQQEQGGLVALWESVILLLFTRKNALCKLCYWCRSEQVCRGPERSLQSCYLKTEELCSLTNCLVSRHWAWLCNLYFSWPVHVSKCTLWVRARYFPTFRNTLTTQCLQTCCEFINGISQIFYLALLLILTVLRSCHFFHTSRSCIAVDSQQWQGNMLAPFFHPDLTQIHPPWQS